MPQYTIKLHTYDPDIVEAFEQLRKNRKQAAFTHEALKHFIASGKASQMIDLMSKGHRPPLLKAAIGTKQQETARDDIPVAPVHRPVAPTVETKRACEDVLKKIFE
jgi:hypothetical protein